MATKTAAATSKVTEDLPLIILQDRLAAILLESGPRKTGELVAAVNHKAVTLRMAKHALKATPRFTTTQRKWDLAARWESPEYPFEQILEGLISGAGCPLTAEVLGREMARTMERDPEAMADVVRKFASDSEHFCMVDDDCFGLSSWLLDTSHNRPDDVLYYSFVEREAVEHFRKPAGKLPWDADAAGAAIQLVLEGKEPVPLKVAAFFAWEAQGAYFEPEEFLLTLWRDEEIGLTSSQVLYRADQTKALLDQLKKMESALGEDFEEEEEAEEAPPTITENDVADIRKSILTAKDTVHLSDIILRIFELEKGEKAYDPTEQELREHLRHDLEVQWLGAGRFAPITAIPENVVRIPESLVIPEYDFATPDGERFDLEMEIAGLESALAKEVHLPIVQDVGDEDVPERPEKRPESVECVLKYHHKIEGTFPLAQMPPGFFAPEPTVQQITLRHESKSYEAWVNLETRLVYGLNELYSDLEMPIAGGLFHLGATPDWDVYDLTYEGESHELAAVAPGRLLELLTLKDEADQERLPTFQVISRLLERQSAGMSYPHIFIEVNLIRRVGRMLVASILSGYPCFSRQAKTGLWVFDAKKRDQPFQKSKRKYVVKES